MDELVEVMEQILSELQSINGKLDDIKGLGIDNSISDICEKIDEATGNGIYALPSVCEYLVRVHKKLDEIQMTIDLKDMGEYH